AKKISLIDASALARRGRRRLSRGAERTNPRACAVPMGRDAEQSGHCAWAPLRARERDGKARGGRRRLSRGAKGTNTRARPLWILEIRVTRYSEHSPH